MPRAVIPLTDVKIKNSKSTDKSYKLFDGGGLYLEVTPGGGKLWRMKANSHGKETRLSFGSYPAVSLADARKKRQAVQERKSQGVDVVEELRIEKVKQKMGGTTFEEVARDWHKNKENMWQRKTALIAMQRLEADVFPFIGKIEIKKVSGPVLLQCLRKIEERGALEQAKRIGQICSAIFDYGVAVGVCENNPFPSLRAALKARASGHHGAITVEQLPEFIRELKLNDARMYLQTKILIWLMLLSFVRTSELIETPWSEIDFEKKQWIIPWQRMKMGKKKFNPRKIDHHVNLPTQAWDLLNELKRYTGNRTYLFVNGRDPRRPVSNGAILAALKRMGYQNEMTGHGFRSLAMGVLKEKLGYRHDVVNRQLAHISGDAYGEAYDRAQFIEERKKMMQDYADYIYSIYNAVTVHM